MGRQLSPSADKLPDEFWAALCHEQTIGQW
jgi:hypothetical protein